MINLTKLPLLKAKMLVGFFGPKSSPEMMTAVFKEAMKARKIQYPNEREVPVKLEVAIEGGWGSPEAFEMVQHLYVADIVWPPLSSAGTKFIVNEVHTLTQTLNPYQTDWDFQLVVARVNHQQKKLTKLTVHSWDSCQESWGEFEWLFRLLSLSQKWSFGALSIGDRKASWATLADASSTGQIGTLTLKTTPLSRGNQEEIKKVWRITEQVKDKDGHLICFGGRASGGEDLATNWQALVDILV